MAKFRVEGTLKGKPWIEQIEAGDAEEAVYKATRHGIDVHDVSPAQSAPVPPFSSRPAAFDPREDTPAPRKPPGGPKPDTGWADWATAVLKEQRKQTRLLTTIHTILLFWFLLGLLGAGAIFLAIVA